MGQPAERGLDAAGDDRHAGKCLARALAIGNRGAIGPQADLAAGRIGVVVADLLVGRVMVDHAVHVAGADAEEQPGRPELPPGVGTPPVGLAQDRDAKPGRFEHPAQDPHRERRMVDVGIAGDEHDVNVVPPPRLHLGPAGRQMRQLGHDHRQDRQHRRGHVGNRGWSRNKGRSLSASWVESGCQLRCYYSISSSREWIRLPTCSAKWRAIRTPHSGRVDERAEPAVAVSVRTGGEMGTMLD